MNMCCRKSIAILLLLGCMVLPVPALGLMQGLSTEKLTRDAVLIVTGDVEDVVSQWSADNKSITTTAVVSVQQVIKGRLEQTKVRVMYMGGQVGDIIMRQSDVAPLRKGEKVLLFLTPEEQVTGGAAFRIQGRAQGTYTIGADHIARKHGFTVDAPDERMEMAIPLETLTGKIRSYVEEQ